MPAPAEKKEGEKCKIGCGLKRTLTVSLARRYHPAQVASKGIGSVRYADKMSAVQPVLQEVPANVETQRQDRLGFETQGR